LLSDMFNTVLVIVALSPQQISKSSAKAGSVVLMAAPFGFC